MDNLRRWECTEGEVSVGLLSKAMTNATHVNKPAAPFKVDHAGFAKWLDSGVVLSDDEHAAGIVLAAHVSLQVTLDHAPATVDALDLASVASMLRWLRTQLESPVPDTFDPSAALHRQLQEVGEHGAAHLLMEIVFALRTRNNFMTGMPARLWFQPDFESKALRFGLPALLRARSSRPGTPKLGDLRGAVTLQGVLDLLLFQWNKPRVLFPGAASPVTASGDTKATLGTPREDWPAPRVDLEGLLLKRSEVLAEDIPSEVVLMFIKRPGFGDEEMEAAHMRRTGLSCGEQVRRWAHMVRDIDLKLWNAGVDTTTLPQVSTLVESAFSNPEIEWEWVLYSFQHLRFLFGPSGKIEDASGLNFDPTTNANVTRSP